MKEQEFGKIVEKMIHFSGQKNYSLAIELGYDVSYISKWINLTMLPTAKNIKKINSTIANFVIKHLDDHSLDDVINYFGINDNKEDDIDEVLKNVIEDVLNQSYLYSYNKNHKKSTNASDDENNCIQKINPILRKKYLDNEISNLLKKYGSSDMLVLCNLFSISNEDKVKLVGGDPLSLDSEEDIFNRENINIRYILDFDENIKDIIFNIVIFIAIVTSEKRIKAEFYSCKFAANTFISVVKNRYSHTAIYNNNRCLTTITSTDEKVVHEIYETLDDIMNTQSRLTFSKKTSEEMILGQSIINHIMDKDLNWLMGEITELFMPSDLFLEIGSEVFSHNQDVLVKLKKIDALLQNVTYKSHLDIFLFESVFRKYIYNGQISFFNKNITLNLEQRKRHIEYMKKILEQDNVNIKLVENSQLSNYKGEEKVSVYLSKDNIHLKEKFDGPSQNYLIVKDVRLENLLKRFFEELWTEEGFKADDKNQMTKLCSESLKYIEILSNNINI
ncbi:MAG: hypothetical protein ACRDD7_04345 [Peptostreptococcaceae bacterium]